MWIDSYAIPKGSPNPEAAYKFMSYLMRPEVSAKVTQLSKVASTNDKAKALLPADITGSAAIYPSPEALAKADFILDVGEAMKYYQDGWTKVKSAQ
ncbi:MAG TPA: spermidine/putrescine ABC transporter substrate-binding protein, partial [Verrucomicrobiae bacterium]|nr:spermidine/putrescine ABC transporter substrate-binding protein [Verrucomicrobiae bacterium]